MSNIPDEKFYTFYMINGGLVQIRLNIEMNIQTRVQKRTSKIQHKNLVSEKECLNENWKALIEDVNNSLKQDCLELVHFNVDK
jgi:hypothetical protein